MNFPGIFMPKALVGQCIMCPPPGIPYADIKYTGNTARPYPPPGICLPDTHESVKHTPTSWNSACGYLLVIFRAKLFCIELKELATDCMCSGFFCSQTKDPIHI